MISSPLDPAAKIIDALGGPSKVATITGVHRTRVSNWMRSKAVGGTGGVVPQKHHLALLNYARENKIRLKAEDFLPSNSSPEAA